MADTLDEPWWETPEGTNLNPGCLSENKSQLLSKLVSGEKFEQYTSLTTALLDNEEECANASETIQPTSSSTLVSSKKRKKPAECFLNVEKEKSKDEKEIEMKPKRKRKKKISDLLTETVPKPGVPADVQKTLNEHFGAKHSVIELEELKLPDSCFLPANDLTHSFSSYLKEICPKWAKLRKNHTEKSSVVMLVICSSALRCLELIRSMATFKGDGKVMKLFAKHLKIQEQIQMLEKDVVHVGVGTPGRIKTLIQQEGLKLTSLKYFILDWNHRDQKLRRLIDIPEIKKETIELLEMELIKLCRNGSVKLGLF